MLRVLEQPTAALLALLFVVSCGTDDPVVPPAPGSDDVADVYPDVEQAEDAGITSDPGTVQDTKPPGPDLTLPEPPYAITSLEPALGHTAGSEHVAVLGEGFADGSVVLFDGLPGEYPVFVHEGRLHVNTPAHPAEAVTVTVIRPDGQAAELESGFTYFNEVEITTIEPPKGSEAGATPVLVTGAGFTTDTLLILGQQKALSIQVLDDNTLLALTPPGPGGLAVDVTVASPGGVSRLKKAFHYQAGPTLAAVMPGAGSPQGGDVVELHGAFFTPPVAVYFGGMPAATEWVSEELVLATTPVHGPGVVDVRLDSAEGTAILEAAFKYVELAQQPLTVAHVAPNVGDVAGGTLVAVTGSAPLQDAEVWFGGAAAELVSTVGSSALVITPPGTEPGPVNVTLKAGSAEATAAAAFEYVETLAITGLSPPAGPVWGDTPVTVKGIGFGAGAQVLIGALPATQVVVLSTTEITCNTPPGSPGLANIKVVDGARKAELPGGFVYVPEKPELYVALPDRGAVAGGTWVQLIGAGFPKNPEVFFGDKAGADVVRVNASYITVRTPPASKGTVDVRVVGDDQETKLGKAFTYFDPKTTFGGTWGPLIDGALNVTVLDGLTAQPVPEAFVILDNDPATPYQALTNEYGQLVFSGPDLSGAHSISVSKEGYVTYSVVHFDAENITIFLTQAAIPEPGLPDGIGPGIVKGKVTGLGKYVAGVPGKCDTSKGSDPWHCNSCSSSFSTCGTNGALCTSLGSSQGKKCVMACEADADCPEDATCQLVEGSKHCIPLPGKKVAVCAGTKPYYRYFDVPLGPLAMTDANDEFLIFTYPTEIAVVCFGGFWLGNGDPNSDDLEYAITVNPKSYFQPVAMGVKRHVFLAPGQLAENLEIELSIPLNRTVHARFEKPPMEDTDFLWARAYLDFGSDGVIKMPVYESLYEDEPFEMPTLPSSFSGEIADASYIFYGGARAYSNPSGYTFPRAYVVRQNVTEPQDDRMLQRKDGTWKTAPTGLVKSLRAAHAFSKSQIYAVGTSGSAYLFDGQQHITMPTPITQTLRAVHGANPDDAWAVGDQGANLHFNGAVWSEGDVPAAQDLRAVHALKDGSVLVAGHQTLLRKSGDGGWVDEGQSGSWYGLDQSGLGDVWLVGRDGQVRYHDGDTWSALAVGTLAQLHDVAALAPTDVWIAGEFGTLLHYDGVGVESVETFTQHNLNGIAHRGPNELIAVGSFGTVLSFDGTSWITAPTEAPDFVQDLHDVVLPIGDNVAFTFSDHQLIMGPIVAPARAVSPDHKETITPTVLEWSADTRVKPHYQVLELFVPGALGLELIWELIVDGAATTAPLPPFATLQGTPGLSTGEHTLRITRYYQEGFDINSFDYTDLGELDRQSWAEEMIRFVTLETEPEPEP